MNKQSFKNIHTRVTIRIERLRDQLSHINALPQLTLLGLITGILAGVVIAFFRWTIDIPLALTLPENSENFEGLNPETRFFLPIGAALILGLIMHKVGKLSHSAGISHVLDRMQNHQGRMPLSNFITQFVGGAVCLLSGQSLGREGPAVHLGAASGSLLGQWLRLPNNSLRPLAGCGVAAAIAASFNTPMAGVIFAMEVVVMEYTISGFIPVILAAVAGTTITYLVFGADITFISAQGVMTNILELPFMAVTGLIIAVFAAAFIRLQGFCCRHSLQRPIWLRFLIAGVVTGIIAIWVPQVMGVGYDTISAAIAGQIGLGLLIAIVIAKLIATGVSLGVGMPGGVVGPSLLMGAVVGGGVGVVAHWLMPNIASDVGFYVILGMGAMMGAVLNAPLAAMVAILELTYNPHIIFPSMLVVVAACLTTRWVFKCDGIFQTLLRIQGKLLEPLNPESNVIHQMLSRSGVRSILEKRLARSSHRISRTEAETLLQHHPHWILLDEKNLLLHPADLLTYLEQHPKSNADTKPDSDAVEPDIDLLEIPARRLQMSFISLEANLHEALSEMNGAQVDALYVTNTNSFESDDSSAATARIRGIVTRERIENYYRL